MAAIDPGSEQRHVRSDSETRLHLRAMLHGRDGAFASRKKIRWRQEIQWALGKQYVTSMSSHNTQCSLRATDLLKNKPKRCKQDKSPNPIFSVLTYWAKTEENTVVDKVPSYLQQTTAALHFWGALFIQWQLHSTPSNTEDIPMPNNVAEELSSKLPSQIGSVASTQLGLKYGNCISHYRAVENVQRELLKVRRGYASRVICCADLCLHSRKKHHDRGTAERRKEVKEGW